MKAIVLVAKTAEVLEVLPAYREQWLSESELIRFDNIGSEKRKEEFLVCRYLLRIGLSLYFFEKKENWSLFSVDSYIGKSPEFNFLLLNQRKILISLSHSKGLIAVAIADVSIGVDVEKIRNFSSNQDEIFREVATEKEFLIYSGLENKRKVEFFLKIWSRKEALSKIDNRGVDFIYLKNIDAAVSLNKDEVFYFLSFFYAEGIFSVCLKESVDCKFFYFSNLK